MVTTAERNGSSNGRQVTQEQTAPQVVIGSIDYDGKLRKILPSAQWYKKVRAMRRDPTIALARSLAIAPVLASTWSVESNGDAPEGAVELIKSIMEPLRTHALRTSFNGCIDFGWQAYEKVFELADVGPFAGLVRLKKLKPLLQDLTVILVDEKTGAYAGIYQDPNGFLVGSTGVTLDVAETLLVSENVEGTYWYGEPTAARAEQAYDDWNVIAKAAERYDKKIAGAKIVVRHPLGTTPVGGIDVDNDTIANSLISGLTNGHGIKIPERRGDVPDDADRDYSKEPAWNIELLSDTANTQTAFVERMKYLDALKVRAFGLPERAVLEGTFGTKAEAEAHGDFAISLMEQRHSDVVQVYNWHLVNHLLRINWGVQAENTVWVCATPLADAARAMIRAIYDKILANPEGFMVELSRMDLDAMRDRLGVPTLPDDERNDLPEPEPEAEPADEDGVPV